MAALSSYLLFRSLQRSGLEEAAPCLSPLYTFCLNIVPIDEPSITSRETIATYAARV